MNLVSLIRTITPLHVGTGQAAGPVDLPIARERATNWPVVPGSSVKGVLRDSATTQLVEQGKTQKDAERELRDVFGTSGGDDDGGKAGALCFTDLRIVFFPVRSYSGTFAYVTSPLAISRLLELLRIAGKPIDVNEEAFQVDNGCKVTTNTVLKATGTQVLFEDLDLAAHDDATGSMQKVAQELARLFGVVPDNMAKRVALVSDSVFSFLVETATEIVTHVTLRFETKTARDGGLRSEESVPAEAIFAGLVTVADTETKAADHAKNLGGQTIQFGGKASTGMGLCRFEVVK